MMPAIWQVLFQLNSVVLHLIGNLAREPTLYSYWHSLARIVFMYPYSAKFSTLWDLCYAQQSSWRWHPFVQHSLMYSQLQFSTRPTLDHRYPNAKKSSVHCTTTKYAPPHPMLLLNSLRIPQFRSRYTYMNFTDPIRVQVGVCTISSTPAGNRIAASTIALSQSANTKPAAWIYPERL